MCIRDRDKGPQAVTAAGRDAAVDPVKLGYMFIGQLQKFGRTSTQIVFSTHVGPRGVDVDEI